jgi:hypothetical protein
MASDYGPLFDIFSNYVGEASFLHAVYVVHADVISQINGTMLNNYRDVLK